MVCELLWDSVLGVTVLLLVAAAALLLWRGSAALRNWIWRAALIGAWVAPATVVGLHAVHVRAYEVAVPVLPAAVVRGAERPKLNRSDGRAEFAARSATGGAPSVTAPVGSVTTAGSGAAEDGAAGSAKGSGVDGGQGRSEVLATSATRTATPATQATTSATRAVGSAPRLAPSSSTVATPATSAPLARAVPWRPPSVFVLLVWTWALGCVFCGHGLLRENRGMRRLCKGGDPVSRPDTHDRVVYWCSEMGLRRPPATILSRNATVPSVVGVFRPTLVLPAESPAGAATDAALVHELAHLRRGDLAALWFARATRCLCWWHP